MRIRWLWIPLVALGMLLGCTGKVPAADGVSRITADELKAELGAAELVIIDVRRTLDWEGSDRKIVGAVKEDGAHPEIWAEKYAKNKKIVLYCA